MIKLDKKGSKYSFIREAYFNREKEAYVLTSNEELIASYVKGHSNLLITNKKIVFINNGRKKDYVVVPYTKMQFCSVMKINTSAILDITINYMQRAIVELREGACDVEAIIQAYTYQNSVDCVIDRTYMNKVEAPETIVVEEEKKEVEELPVEEVKAEEPVEQATEEE